MYCSSFKVVFLNFCSYEMECIFVFFLFCLFLSKIISNLFKILIIYFVVVLCWKKYLNNWDSLFLFVIKLWCFGCFGVFKLNFLKNDILFMIKFLYFLNFKVIWVCGRLIFFLVLRSFDRIWFILFEFFLFLLKYIFVR